MERKVIQFWNSELEYILGKNSLEKLTLFFEFLEMPKKQDTEKKDREICAQILNALSDYESGRIGARECMDELLLTEQYLDMLCSYIDPGYAARSRASDHHFAQLIKWVGDYPVKVEGNLELGCRQKEDTERFPVPKRYWAIAYWARNTSSHDMLGINGKWCMQIRDSVLYVMIASLWKYKNQIRRISAEQEVGKEFDREAYLKKIVKEYEKDGLQKTFVRMNSVVYDVNVPEEEDEEQDQVISATDILKSFQDSVNYIRLVGEAGIGKSRLMRHLEYLDAKGGEILPIYVELKNLVNVRVSPLQLLSERLGVPEGTGRKILENLPVHIFMDGVNEMICPDKEKYLICSKLDELAGEYPKVKVLISDRENSAVWISNEIPTYLLCKLDKNMQEQFIDLNCEADMAEKVKAILRENAGLGKELNTPIMLVFLIETVRNGSYGKEMDSEGAILKCYVKGLIDREVRSKGEIRAKKIEYLLSYLVISDAASNKKDSDDSGCLYYEEGKLLREFKKCADEYGFAGIDMSEMLELVTQMGFLRTVKGGDVYAFSNQFLENYFFAYAIDKGMYDL